MEKLKNKFPQEYVLLSVAYLTLASVLVGSLVTLPEEASPLRVIGVFIGLVVVMALQRTAEKYNLDILFLLVLTLLASSLYFIGVDPGIFLIIFFIISAQAMIYLMDWRGVLFILGLAVISSLFFIFQYGFQSGLMVMFIYGGGYFFFGAVGRAMVRAQEAREHSEQLYRELQAAHEQLQDYVYRVEELAVAQERNRLAREVHDSIGHRLTVSAVQLEGAQRLVPKDPDKAVEMIGTVREQVKQALSELRQTVATLREPVETGMSIEHSLQRLAASF
jgi:signal transduction histidine kinase